MTGPNSSADARIAASADNWKRKLLDLTKRNRALNFKMNKVSTVAIVDEQPAELFRQLYLAERAMKFAAAPEPPVSSESRPSAAAKASIPGDPPAAADEAMPSDEDDGSQSADFVPYDPTALGERHKDDTLQTASTPEGLDRSLRRLDEQARLSIEEQGVNTLFLALGMLHYTEATDSSVVLKAPLVLLPVELTRKSARSGYTVAAAEDDPIVNPALAEYLRRDHGISLPELPDSNAIADDYDLQTLLKAVDDAVATKASWGVKTDVYLGLFSFQKFVMYKDLETNGAALQRHRLVRQLVTRAGEATTDAIVGLPNEIRTMDLDREYPPEQTFQVVDADSSQLRAIAAAARQFDLVIEGPPGTGKSQTITNLIAQALGAGRSVLFVAEKMAALSVVYDRLVKAGLGEFCLELHSTKANKRAVMRELAASFDASLQTIDPPKASTQRLPEVRAGLAEYTAAVHTPHGALGVSPFRAYGELGRVLDAPRRKLDAPIDTVTRETLDQTIRDLQDLAAAAAEIGVPAQHPWRDTTRTLYTADDLETVHELVRDFVAKSDEVVRRGAAVREAFDLPPIRAFADVDTAAAIASAIGASPGAPLAVLSSAAWNAPPPDATALVARGRELAALRDRAAKSFTPAALEQDHAGDAAHIEQKSQGFFSFLAFLDGRYRAIKNRWLAYRLPSYQRSLVEQAAEMKQIDRLRALRGEIAAADAKGRELFGALWLGDQSDWSVLERYIKWVVDFRALCVRHELTGKALEIASHRTPDITDVVALQRIAADAYSALALLRAQVGWPADYLATEPLDTISARARALSDNAALAARWASFEAARRTASRSLAAELLPAAMSGELPFPTLAPSFLRAFWMKWLTAVVRARPALERFHTLAHEQRVAEFREFDRRVLLENRARLVRGLRDRVQQKLREDGPANAMPYLRKEMARQRGLSPLRKTMRQAEPAIRAIKPCFMMSPLTVAQLLDGGAPSFDVVIFDEASQLPAEDAVGAVMRTSQLIVVGDPKQLPPTNFFAVSSGTANVPVGEDGAPLFEDSESILEEFMGAGVPMSRLKWHYRSAHESLIAFSNVEFYESDLYTFPSVDTSNATHGLQFEYIADGVYEGKGLNAVEAKRVADEVVAFAKEQLERRARGEPTLSLGVGTFNLRQQVAIQDELEQRRRDDPSIEPFFGLTVADGSTEPFFVKNLENIQGDERDVIFISVTYAKAADGKLRYNFGPLNGENGWRRLNVLTTRSRQRMKVFSSMRGDEIDPSATSSRGAQLLREFLIFAERGRLESTSATQAADGDSPFERDVLSELTRRALRVVPQVGVAGYRIDMAVLDDAVQGRFLCGIECDGVAYHQSQTARDRDRLRQQVLELRGWTIHRVWSTDWFKDRQGQIDRLLRLVEESRTHARDQAEAERKARDRAAADAARAAAEAAELAKHAPPVAAGDEADYVRPVAESYAITPGEGRYSSDILETPFSQLLRAITSVVETESPVHTTDLLARVAGMWDTRPGSRIQARILDAATSAEQAGVVRRRGDFWWTPSDAVTVRSRAGTRIPADRIAPEEYTAAVLTILATGHGFTRPQLTNEVRALLGYSRTGAALEESITAAIDALLATGTLGEGSTGIRLRT